MNKKCMIKMGAVNLGVLIVLTLVLIISLTILTSADTEQYSVGEKIKIDLGDAGEYTIFIKTPTKTFIQIWTKIAGAVSGPMRTQEFISICHLLGCRQQHCNSYSKCREPGLVMDLTRV